MGQNAHAKLFVIGPKFTGVFFAESGKKIVVDHLVFHIEISAINPDIFAVKI